MKRREFLEMTAAASLAAATPRRSAPRAGTLLRGGLVYDGLGQAPRLADVLVEGDRIRRIGRGLGDGASTVIDVSGLAVAPGFIDIHSHSDHELLANPRAESKIRQGVTTEIIGQDGGSLGPWRGRPPGSDPRTGSISDFFSEITDAGCAVNVASMIGAGTVRRLVVGLDDRQATPDELERMVALVADAIARGAVGLSSGLEYVPGAFASLEELVALAGPLRGTGLPYASHMRNEDDQLLGAIEEAINVGRLAGVPVHVSHLKAQGRRNWWKAGPALELLDRAAGDGLEVTFDRYPYVAYSTGLASLFPIWSRDGGTEQFLRRLSDRSTAPRIEQAVREKVAKLGSWDAVQITSTGSEELSWARGRRLGALAAEREMEPYRLLTMLIVEDRSRSGMVGFGMSEENTAAVLAHPLGMVCSDGSALATYGDLSHGSPHPRSYGTFPRVLGHYARDMGLFPLETAIHKMTAMPADRLRLEGRGRVAEGSYADLVVFDPDTVADQATFEEPHQYPAGIPHVMVNGRLVLRDGEQTGELPGKPLRAAVS